MNAQSPKETELAVRVNDYNNQGGSTKMTPIRIMIVDDHAVIRAGLRMLIEQDHTMTVVAMAGTPAEALTLAAAEKPDIIVLDLILGEEDGLDDGGGRHSRNRRAGDVAAEEPDHRRGPRLCGRDRVDGRPSLRRTPRGLERQRALRVRRPEDVPPAEADEGGLGRLQREREQQPVDRDLADPVEDAGDPMPEVA